MMAEARKAKLSEQTADRLYELIVDEGRYPLGSKLPNENELSQAQRSAASQTGPWPGPGTASPPGPSDPVPGRAALL